MKFQNNTPVLSVVIASYNSAAYIRECLESLAAEHFEKVEYLLIDGGSKDDTMKIVEEYRDLLSVVVSESDTGQSEAFNKGFRLAKGSYLTWLNSDDVFAPGSLNTVIKHIEKTCRDWYTANVVYFDNNSKIMKCCRSGGFEPLGLKFGVLNVFGPSSMFSRKVFEELGPFREDFHYSMDTEYWWRIAAAGYRYERISVYFWALRLHADAKTAAVVTDGLDARPQRMVEEHQWYRSEYFRGVTDRQIKATTFLLRLLRVLRGPYVFSWIDTIRNKGKKIQELPVVD